jgi:pimeloyl-ACP methyl ester carboxylesterase
MRNSRLLALLLLAAGSGVLFAPSSFARDDSQQILTIDHHVAHTSTIPAIAGQQVQLYVRESVQAEALTQTSFTGRVVLLDHGATGSSERAFDPSYQDYSWMAFLAKAGFDVFAMDHTGYGLSTRPALMDDPCNASPEQQQANLVPVPLADVCPPTYPNRMSSLASDWDEVAQVVDYLRALRGVPKVSLIGWSMGSGRVGGYAAMHPEKVDRLVLDAGGGNLISQGNPTAGTPAPGAAITVFTRQDWEAGWDRQVKRDDQFDPAIRDALWEAAMESDSVAAGWGPGTSRAPLYTPGTTYSMLATRVQAPTLVIWGEFDASGDGLTKGTVDQLRAIFDAISAPQKVAVEIAGTSHYALWETRHMQHFQSSLDWLTEGAIKGIRQGSLRLGD